MQAITSREKSLLTAFPALATAMIASTLIFHCSKSNYLEVGYPAKIVESQGIYLRATPSSQGRKIILIPMGQSVNVLAEGLPEQLYEIKSKWYRVTYGKYEGWMWGGLAKSDKNGTPTTHIAKAPGDVSVDTNDRSGITRSGLLQAIEKCDIEYVEKAAAAAVNMNFWYRDHRFLQPITPLMRACSGGSYYRSNGAIVSDCRSADLVKILIKGGALVNAQNPGDQTALMYAASHGDVGVVKALLDAGADVHAKSAASYHNTALRSADNHPKVRELLIARGAIKL